MTGEVVLSGDNLAIGYTRGRVVTRTVMTGINCAVARGEMIGLIGPNGTGKSTLLRTLCALQPAQTGSIFLLGRDIREYTSAERAERISVVLTTRVRVGAMRVHSLVALGRYPHTPWSGTMRKEDREAVDQALRMTDTEHLKDRCVSELSDGERQKVMLARAIAQEPTILVLDEPTAFLDLPRRVEIVGILKKLTREKNIAVLLSTHDLDLAIKTADRLWVLSRNTLFSGAPEDLVLDGTLKRAFSRHGLVFNPADGQFVMHEGHGKVIHVSGEGLETVWTRRALERDGYSVEVGGGEPLVRVETSEEEPPVWRVDLADKTLSCLSILELVGILRVHLSP